MAVTKKLSGPSSEDALALGQRMVRKRYGGPRSKTGCITCRIRHVKCDEGRPSCSRCIKTGRKCDGYQRPSWEVVDISSMATMMTMSGDPRAANNHHAGRSFKFFETMTAGYLSGLFDTSLWKEVLRASQHNDAMWHAATALGSAHEAYLHRRFDMETSEEDWAIQQYNRAIRSLTKADGLSDQPPLDVIMAASILFMAFEMLRREYGKAINHIKSGISIFGEHNTKVLRYLDGRSPSPDANMISIGELEHVLRQLETHLCEISMERTTGPSMPRRAMIERKPLPLVADGALSSADVGFASLTEARLELDGYWHNMMFVLHEITEPDVFESAFTPELLIERCVDFQIAFATWRTRFDLLAAAMNSSPDTSPTARERKIMAQLQIYHQAGAQLLETSFAADETVWDSYRSKFEWSLDLCDIVVATVDDDKETHPIGSGGFQLDQGIVGPCFHILWKCRAARVRQRIFRLLEQQQRQEGLWDAPLVAAVGRLIEDDERGPGMLDEAAARDAPPEEIPIWRRVLGVDVTYSSEGRHAVIRFMKQRAMDNPEVIITRHVLNW